METIPGLLDEAVEGHGDRTALAMRRSYRLLRWTYLDVQLTSRHIAACLQQRGVEKGDRVVLWAPNSPEWVAAYFGCMRAGAIVVPLDVRTPVGLARKVIDQTQPKLAVLSLLTSEGAECLGVPHLKLEDLDSLLTEAGLQPKNVSVQPEDVAEVVYTSGATGDPKGVVLTHRNIVSNVQAAMAAVPSVPSYRLLSLLPLSHMLEQTVGLLAPLTGGASIYYPQSRQPTAIFRALREHHVTTLLLVPQALRLFMSAIESRVRERGKERTWARLHRLALHTPIAIRRRLFAEVHRQLGGSLKFIICGGAYLDPELAQKWEALGVPVLQGYGATEASPIISCDTFRQRKLGAVGKPVAGVEVKLSDDGEVLVRGPNVTQGYWQNAQATAAAFQGAWYKTGDLGTFDEDGFLHFKGRKKDLIVLPSGLNVYPDDVEAALKQHPAVADAVVVGLPQKGQDVQVHAVLLLKSGAGDAAAIVERVNSGLAEHQRVQGYTVWPEEDLPRTHTAKVKKHEVLERLGSVATSQRPGVPGPSASAVQPLVRLVARVSRKRPEDVQPSARLGADLGLDSLGRVELLAAVEAELGAYLDESSVSENTTVSGLESLIRQAGKAIPGREYKTWPLRTPTRLCRAALQSLVAFPLLRFVAPMKVRGREELEELRGPVLFAANHASHLDTPAVLAALPRHWRFRTAVAAAADVWFAGDRFKSWLSAVLFNAFPFSRGDSIRPSLEQCSRLLDAGWSVLIYPEGTRSTSGHMGPFKSGTGLMAVELGVPVVPVRVSGTYEVLPKGAAFPRRGRVSVRFGHALRFSPRTSYIEATTAIQRAVEALADE